MNCLEDQDELHCIQLTHVGYGDKELVEAVEFFSPVLVDAGIDSDQIEVE